MNDSFKAPPPIKPEGWHSFLRGALLGALLVHILWAWFLAPARTKVITAHVCSETCSDCLEFMPYREEDDDPPSTEVVEWVIDCSNITADADGVAWNPEQPILGVKFWAPRWPKIIASEVVWVDTGGLIRIQKCGWVDPQIP